MTLLYMRHGETRALKNSTKTISASPLSHFGEQQIQAATTIMQRCNIQPTLILYSTLPTLQSARIILNTLGPTEIRREPLIQEREWGRAARLNNYTFKKRWPGGINTVPGAESDEALRVRAQEAWDMLNTLTGIVLAVGSEDFWYALIQVITGQPTSEPLALGQAVRLQPEPIQFLR